MLLLIMLILVIWIIIGIKISEEPNSKKRDAKILINIFGLMVVLSLLKILLP